MCDDHDRCTLMIYENEYSELSIIEERNTFLDELNTVHE